MIIGAIIVFETKPPRDDRVGVICNNCSYDVSEKPSYTDKLFDPISIFTLFLVFSTIMLWRSTERLAFIAGDQADDMKDSVLAAQDAAKAATRSAEVAEKSIVAAQRAWIKADVYDTMTLYFNENFLNPSIKINMTNVGNGPATNIFLYVWCFIDSEDDSNFTKWLEKECDIVRHQEKNGGFTIFQNDTHPPKDANITHGCNVSIDDMRKGLAFGKKFAQDGFILRIGGCVNYTFATSDKFHQTRFLRTLRGKRGNWISPDEIVNGPFGPPKFKVDASIIGMGDFAD